MDGSRVPGFYRLSVDDRRAELRRRGVIDTAGLAHLCGGALAPDDADKLVENAVGVLGVPVGIGLNMQINGRDHFVPMAVEEPSVVAAFSHAAKLARAGGGFRAEADAPLMVGQIQLVPPNERTLEEAKRRLTAASDQLMAAVDRALPNLVQRGGGARKLTLRPLRDPDGGPSMLIVHAVIDVREAMGANSVNHAMESIAPLVAQISGLSVHLRILSNLAVDRKARAFVRIPCEVLGGAAVAERIAEADRFARLDPYRAATHNKGILNGIDAVALATGNDWRSIEAGAHAWAARDGQYRGLTRWVVDGEHLDGRIELPMAVGVVGGTTEAHPTIVTLRRLLGADSAQALAGIFAAVGLAQNLGALRALATEGIQRGHMNLHARQLAVSAGARREEVDAVVQAALARGPASRDNIARALSAHRKGATQPHAHG